METMFIELITGIFNDCFKALKWKKQGNNYRYISKDGLGKIINFQKSKWNTTECLEFFINYGVYIETTDTIANKTFKEYECQFRARTTYLKGKYLIDNKTDLLELKRQIITAVKEAMEFFDKVENKDAFVEMLLSGVAQQYAETPVMHYGTCKLLVDMGYYKEIYDIIKSCGGEYFENLKKEIEEKL